MLMHRDGLSEIQEQHLGEAFASSRPLQIGWRKACRNGRPPNFFVPVFEAEPGSLEKDKTKGIPLRLWVCLLFYLYAYLEMLWGRNVPDTKKRPTISRKALISLGLKGINF